MWIIGHRGASGLAPENTLEAFVRGVAAGADIVECDVHSSRDGVPVVIHDGTLGRTTNGSGPVGALALAELRELDAGAGTRLPTLAEVFEAVEVPVQVEIKDPAAVDAVVAFLAEAGRAERTWVIAFDHRLLVEIGARVPGLRTGALCGTRPADPGATCRGVGAAALCPLHTWVDAALMEACRAAQVAVMPWTVNAPADVLRLRDLGVTSVTTDRPDMAAAALGRTTRRSAGARG